MGEYDIRPFRDGDEESLLATFNLVFAETGLPPRSMREWEWAYRENPAGKRIYVAEHEGEIVAQYAGLPGRIRFEGREHTFVDVVDSMVHPDHRLGLKRPGLFIKTAEPFLAEYGRPDRDLAFYGWPIEKAWPINKRFLGYQQVRSESVLARAPGEGPTELPAGVEVLTEADESVAALFDRCAQDWRLAFVRDAAFLRWRYFTNPYHDYTVLGLRGADGALRGYAVHRAPGADMPETALLVDLLADDEQVGRELTEGALALARRDGASGLATIQVEWTPWFHRFQEWGWMVWPSEWIMVASLFDPRLEPDWMRRHWWYQMGDLDVV